MGKSGRVVTVSIALFFSLFQIFVLEVVGKSIFNFISNKNKEVVID